MTDKPTPTPMELLDELENYFIERGYGSKEQIDDLNVLRQAITELEHPLVSKLDWNVAKHLDYIEKVRGTIVDEQGRYVLDELRCTFTVCKQERDKYKALADLVPELVDLRGIDCDAVVIDKGFDEYVCVACQTVLEDNWQPCPNPECPRFKARELMDIKTYYYARKRSEYDNLQADLTACKRERDDFRIENETWASKGRMELDKMEKVLEQGREINRAIDVRLERDSLQTDLTACKRALRELVRVTNEHMDAHGACLGDGDRWAEIVKETKKPLVEARKILEAK